MSIEFLNSETSLFYQRIPIVAMSHLDEIALTGIALSGREAGAPYESPVVGQRGYFEIKGFLPGGSIQAGFSAQRPWQEINYLWNLTREAKVNFRINAYKTGTETDVEAYKSALVFVKGSVTNPALEGGKAMQSGDASRNLTGMTVQAAAGFELLPLSNTTHQTVPATADQDATANSVFFARAIGEGPMQRRAGQHGIVIAAFDTGNAEAVILRTIDYGATWTKSTTEVFANTEDAIAPLIVDLPQTNQYRVIVFRATTDGGNPNECAYIDVVPGTVAWAAGAWSVADISAADALFTTASFKVHDGMILCGDDGGNIHYSKNKALDWTLANCAATSDVRCFAKGPDGRIWIGCDGTEVFYSEDGGLNWSATATAPSGATTGIAVNYAGHIYIIDGTTLKYSTDDGLSWSTRTVSADITAYATIHFDPYGYTGILCAVDAGTDDRLYRTEDGGVTWIAITTDTANTGLNDAWLVHENMAYITGDAVTSLAWVEKIFGPGQGS